MIQRQRAVAAVKKVATTVATAAAVACAPAPLQVDPLEQLKGSQVQPFELLPDVLLGYQQRWIADDAQLKVAEKGRRVGLTWAEAADDVLIASAEGGSNVFYISATQDMAREYIEACAMWARAFDAAASEVSEGLWADEAEPGKVGGDVRHIKTYEIVFPKSGKRIVALSSRPTNLRGKQGVIVIDEAAFAPDLAGLLKAAMAMLLWGDKVRIISTHDGVENPFNNLVTEVRAGKRGKNASVHRISFDDALRDGLYRRVCLRRGLPWSAEAEAQWALDARRFYGDDAAEELDCVPSQGGGRYFSLALIEQRSVAVHGAEGAGPGAPHLVRGKWPEAFAWQSPETRHYAINGWLQEQLAPALAGLHRDRRHVLGLDFARKQNLTSISVLEEGLDLVARQVLQIELHNCPFTSQWQILEWLVLRLPRFGGGALDAGGNGAQLAEQAAQRFGSQLIERLQLSQEFYLTHMTRLRADLEDGTLRNLPRDVQCRDDLRAVERVRGIPMVNHADSALSGAAKAAASEGGVKVKRHGDYAISLMLANYARRREVGLIDFTPAPASGLAAQLDGRFEDDEDLAADRWLQGLGSERDG